MGIGNC